jgi:hypothetical protein
MWQLLLLVVLGGLMCPDINSNIGKPIAAVIVTQISRFAGKQRVREIQMRPQFER